MKLNYGITFLSLVILVSSCIGDDFIDDLVEPEVRITNLIDTIGIDDTYQFEANFLNNVGQETESTITWSSTSPEIVNITEDGLASGLTFGSSLITASASFEGVEYTTDFDLTVGESTASPASLVRTGTIRTTSSYELKGEFEMSALLDNKLRLNISDDYVASSALPGLYIYLSNNPNSIAEAFEIGAVEVFSGAHFYDISGVGLNDFGYVLYYCKPFNVKVGDGKFDN